MTSCLFRIQYADGRVEERAFNGGQFRIGRESGDVTLHDPNASAAHGQLDIVGANVTYSDLGSANGSFDGNDRRLTGQTPLSPGQSVQIGRSAITFLGSRPSSRVSAQPAAYAAPGAPPPAAAASGGYGAPRAAAGVSGLASGPYSHPDRAVRHSYPLAISAAGFSDAFRLLMQTAPFVLARLGVLGALTVATIVWWVVLVGGFAFLAKATPLLGWAWVVAWCVVAGGIWRFVARYFLYLLKAAHIAVLTELITTGRIANGNESMFHYGRRIVTERFGEVNILFGLDMLIDGIVSAFNRTLDWVASLLPIPGLDSVTSVVRSVLRASTTYIDETIFSYNLARGDENAFRSSRDGLVYYAQNAREILKTGIWVVVADKVLSVAIWFIMLAPAFALAYVMPGAAGLATVVIASLFAANVRSAILRPLFLTMVMVKFHSVVQGQSIELMWDQRLSTATSKFGELKQKADAWVRPAQPPQPAATAQLA
jgi:FHA domain